MHTAKKHTKMGPWESTAWQVPRLDCSVDSHRPTQVPVDTEDLLGCLSDPNTELYPLPHQQVGPF